MLRERGLAQRRSLSVRERHAMSARIRDNLNQMGEFQAAPLILTYVSAKDGEVETLPLIVALTQGGRRVAVPSVVSRGFMIWRQITGVEQLVGSRFGIPEPGHDCLRIERFPADALILVPAIVYSPSGYRVGYGGGYFDRFLKDFPGVTIGVAFQMQVINNLPLEPHDVPVDRLVTDRGIIECAEVRRKTHPRD